MRRSISSCGTERVKLTPDQRIVPALMFHTVGLQEHRWLWPELAEPLESFERKIQLLERKGFYSICWDELYGYMAGETRLPPNSILLTFDDGYLDNWVFVYPILKRYGFKATIFVNPDFVDPASSPRATLEDVWAGRCTQDELRVDGFLSWEEMRRMEASGLVDIQSHALTHTWYFSGPRILDFHAPAELSPYPWLFWNARPDRKPFYLAEDQRGFLPWGYPVLEHEKSLLARRFVPDEGAMSMFVDYVREHGGPALFERTNWREELLRYAGAQFTGGHVPGAYESESDRRERIRHELAESKRLIETHLNKSVEYICWPGGGNDPEVQAMAREVGYKSWTLGSRDASSKRNVPGAAPVSIKRMGTTNRIEIGGRCVGSGGAAYQLMRIAAHQRSSAYALLVRAYKMLAMTRLVGQA
jgi:hypothetical protein